MLEQIKSQLNDTIRIKQQMLNDKQLLKTIEKVAQVCINTYKSGNKLLLAGNGGSAADAQHIAAELVGRFEKDRKGIPAIALTTNSSTMTAVANDYGYNSVFHRQIEAFAQKGDVFIGYSTSGSSANVVAAVQACKESGIVTVGMTGAGGGDMAELCDVCVRVPSDNTARIQESHIVIGHILCALIEGELF